MAALSTAVERARINRRAADALAGSRVSSCKKVKSSSVAGFFSATVRHGDTITNKT